MSDPDQKWWSETADAAFLFDLGGELRNARAKFPHQSFWRTLAALTGEVGELNQAILQHRSYEAIRGEAIQVAVMALRVANDCGLDETQEEAAATERDAILAHIAQLTRERDELRGALGKIAEDYEIWVWDEALDPPAGEAQD